MSAAALAALGAPGPPLLRRPGARVAARLALAALVFLTAAATRTFYAEDLLREERAGNPDANFTDVIRRVSQKFTFDYEARAIAILEGRGILFSAPADRGSILGIAHPPGYQVFIAAVYHFTPRRLKFVTQAQIVIDSLVAAGISLVCASLFGTPAGFLGGMLIAASPHLAWNCLVPMPDTASAWPLLAAVLLLRVAVRKGGLMWYVGVGLLVGVSCWLRTNALMLAPILAATAYALARPRRLAAPVALVATTYALVLPVTVRNWTDYGVFVPLGWGVGRTMIEGIADYDFENRFGFPKFDKDITKWDDATIKTHLDREEALKRRSMGVIYRHPFWFATVMARRALFQWSYETHTDVALDTPFHTRVQGPLAPTGSRPLVRRLVIGMQSLYSTAAGRVLSLLGLLWLLLLGRRVEATLFSIVPLYFFVFQSVLHTEFRYCLVIHYFLFALMGVGLAFTVRAASRLARASHA